VKLLGLWQELSELSGKNVEECEQASCGILKADYDLSYKKRADSLSFHLVIVDEDTQISQDRKMSKKLKIITNGCKR